MDGHHCSYLKPVRTNYESFLYSFTFREQHPELIYGVERGGNRGSTAYTVYHRAGHSHAARASLASVLKERRKKVPITEAEAEAEAERIFFHQSKGTSGSW